MGPVKDAYNIGSNPQFSLDVEPNASGAVWILLTRHITDIADFRDNKEYIAVLVYKGNGKRIYYPCKSSFNNDCKQNTIISKVRCFFKYLS